MLTVRGGGYARGTQLTRLRSVILGLGLRGRRTISSGEERPSEGKRFAAVWGNGDYGRLGLGSLESRWRPAFCSAFGNESLRGIACGGAHTLFLTETGCVYTTGLNDFGQLGISDDKSYTTTLEEMGYLNVLYPKEKDSKSDEKEPLKVLGLPNEIIKIYAGYHHSSAITVDGELYMWGKNSNGQLGLGKSNKACILSQLF
ncbi:hypothetical protein RHMOL_Rhmol10G0185100 [Rhododendron molle]|uniref:Uncharacterized protein n=1 Tax=Rhododendron molle TaxID=49168 RepID=A0ACC0M4T0_RHOML|nr:hypothetical protein RHMOL_Rhmol10G0185100 [Rhododendron molle]